MKKSTTKYVQYQPYVTINRERVRPIKNGDSFTCSVKDFNFHMNCDHLKENLMKTICDYTNIIDITNSSLIQNRGMPKIRLLENQMGFTYL